MLDSDSDSDTTTDKRDASNADSDKAAETPTGKTVYKIQFLVSPKALPKGSGQFKGLSPVDSYREDGSYKYTYGEYPSMQAATADLPKIRKKFKDAFVIKMRDGKRIK